MSSSANHFSLNSSSFIPILSQKEVLKASRYGFNGKMKDNEVEGEGNSYDYWYRMYDPRLGRFTKIGRLNKQYPESSPYSAFENSPILFVDPTGKFSINVNE